MSENISKIIFNNSQYGLSDKMSEQGKHRSQIEMLLSMLTELLKLVTNALDIVRLPTLQVRRMEFWEIREAVM